MYTLLSQRINFFTLSDVLRKGFCLSHVEKPKIMILVQLALGKSCILRLNWKGGIALGNYFLPFPDQQLPYPEYQTFNPKFKI